MQLFTNLFKTKATTKSLYGVVVSRDGFTARVDVYATSEKAARRHKRVRSFFGGQSFEIVKVIEA